MLSAHDLLNELKRLASEHGPEITRFRFREATGIGYHYIYDRWGTKVYESTDRNNVWIGTYMNQSGEPLPEGVYVWKLITAPALDQKVKKEFMGHVTLLK